MDGTHCAAFDVCEIHCRLCDVDVDDDDDDQNASTDSFDDDWKF